VRLGLVSRVPGSSGGVGAGRGRAGWSSSVREDREPEEGSSDRLRPRGCSPGALAGMYRTRPLGSRLSPGVAGRGRCGQASKGAWGMSWRQEAQGRGRRRNVRGSCQPSFDPGMPEPTRGTETSQYPEEEKETSTPSVAASERGPAQTGRGDPPGVVGPRLGPESLAERRGIAGHRG
jgi:hypothetical protein